MSTEIQLRVNISSEPKKETFNLEQSAPLDELNQKVDSLGQRVSIMEKHSVHKAKQKAWEGSLSRTLLLASLTYGVCTGLLYLIQVETPYLVGVIPTTGYLLSRPGLSFCQRIWEKYFYKPQEDSYISQMQV